MTTTMGVDLTVGVSFEQGVGYGSIALDGELDAYSAKSLRPRVLALVRMPAGYTLRLRLEQLAFCDLAGLDAIMSLTRLGYATEIIVGASPVRRLFELTGLEGQIDPADLNLEAVA